MELYDKPGIIITNDNNVIRTTKIKKYIFKNKIEYKEIQYLENPDQDFKVVERLLKEMENNYLGLGPLKNKIVQTQNTEEELTYFWWDTKCKGWLYTKDKQASDWPWQKELGTRFMYIGEKEKNETFKEAIERFFKLAITKTWDFIEIKYKRD